MPAVLTNIYLQYFSATISHTPHMHIFLPLPRHPVPFPSSIHSALHSPIFLSPYASPPPPPPVTFHLLSPPLVLHVTPPFPSLSDSTPLYPFHLSILLLPTPISNHPSSPESRQYLPHPFISPLFALYTAQSVACPQMLPGLLSSSSTCFF